LKITVFGGSNPRPGDPAYEQAYQLGRSIGINNNTILTGGYMGTMEAVSKGVREAGGHTVGVTCAEIERWRKAKANPYVLEEWHLETLIERLNKLIETCDVAIALPGGVGTMAEIAVMWNHLIIGDIDPKPLFLVGKGWQDTISAFLEHLGMYTSTHDRSLLTFVDDYKQVPELLSHKSVDPQNSVS
jgi:uncharacterized protein (TIGR00730 family)